MKREELMINDIVFDYTNSPVKVCAVGQDIVVKNSFGVGSLEPNELSPIPLTDEILVKNGFEDVTEEGDRIRLLGTFDENDNITFVNLYPATIGYGTDTPQLKVYYVHQLQHLLRLAGIEKEIEL